jgi:hypothetical protein
MGRPRLLAALSSGIEHIRERHMASISLGARDTGLKKQLSTEAPL